MVQLAARDTHASDMCILEAHMDDIPGIGLITDKITFDGITISNFRFDNTKKYVVVKPGEEFLVHFSYTVDASKLSTLHMHHLVIGLHNDGPQTCVLHSLGIKDSQGDTALTLKAPEKTGAYQVRFCHTEGLTEDKAQHAWWKGDGPSAKTIVGIVIVK